jgi:1-acyl-sn-glycerol-3-phosphate acyltransferase
MSSSPETSQRADLSGRSEQPSVARELPPFRFPLSFAPKFVPPLLLGRRASLGEHAEWLLRRTGRQPVVRGEEHIPERGPFVAVVNHYQRRYYWVGWNAFLVSMIVGRRRGPQAVVHWLMNDGFEQRRRGAIPWPWWLLRWLFRRVARMYDMVPVSTSPHDKGGRVTAVRRMIDLVSPRDRSREGEPVGLLPEARNQPRGVLGRPPPATGRLLLELARRGVPLLPVGVHELDGETNLTFGPPFEVELPPDLSNQAAAEEACRQAMVAIGRLLPRELWGAYEGEIGSAEGE